MRYLTVEEVAFINETILETNAGIRDRAAFESAVMRPQASAFGQDAYPTLSEKAAALTHSLVQNHPFVDGNKRTATLALAAFLKLNGQRIMASDEDLVNFIREIAQGKHDVPEIAEWLNANTEQVDN